jgi:hypothetical protein
MLKIIAIGLVFYYLIWPLFRFLFKGFIITQVHRKMSEQDIRSKQATAQARKEGSIDVDFVPPSGKKTSKKPLADEGDYVPYEEIKD